MGYEERLEREGFLWVSGSDFYQSSELIKSVVQTLPKLYYGSYSATHNFFGNTLLGKLYFGFRAGFRNIWVLRLFKSHSFKIFSLVSFLSLSLSFVLFRATGMAYGSSQARGRIGAAADSLHQSQSKTGSEPCLQPILQLTTMLDPFLFYFIFNFLLLK